MSTAAYAQAVTWISRSVSGTDNYGNDTFAEKSTATRAVFAPGGSTELTGDRDQVTTQPTLYDVDRTLAVKATDVFVVDGDRYQVDGDPQAFTNPFTGRAPGWVVPLRKVTG